MPSANQLAAGDPQLLDAVRRARQLLNRRALAGAAAGVVPIPGLDWMVDAALLSRLMPAINAEFGLTPEQLDRLPRHKREEVQRAVSVVGSMLIGKFVTKDLVVRVLQRIGVRLAARRVARYVPLAGQALSAAIGYTAIRYLGEEHIRDCVQVCRDARLLLPAPEAAPKVRRRPALQDS